MNIIFQIEGGLGKCIAATAVCKAIKTQYPKYKLIVISGYPKVFLCNPYVSRAFNLVLNGSCNNITHNYASASGYNIASALDCAFHANNIIVPGMPTPSGAVSKQLYYMPTGGVGSPCAVYIM